MDKMPELTKFDRYQKKLPELQAEIFDIATKYEKHQYKDVDVEIELKSALVDPDFKQLKNLFDNMDYLKDPVDEILESLLSDIEKSKLNIKSADIKEKEDLAKFFREVVNIDADIITLRRYGSIFEFKTVEDDEESVFAVIREELFDDWIDPDDHDKGFIIGHRSSVEYYDVPSYAYQAELMLKMLQSIELHHIADKNKETVIYDKSKRIDESKPLTVGELIAKLKKYDADTPVTITDRDLNRFDITSVTISTVTPEDDEMFTNYFQFHPEIKGKFTSIELDTERI